MRELYLLTTLSLVLLILPLGLENSDRFPRRWAYQTVPMGHGPFDLFEKEIFDEKEPLDIAFIGPSYLWNGLDLQMAQERWGTRDKPFPKMKIFGGNWFGVDLYYAIARDLTRQRQVKTVVLATNDDPQIFPHRMAYQWLTFEWDLFKLGSPFGLRDRMMLFGEFVLGAPRHFLSFLRPNHGPISSYKLDNWGASHEARGFNSEKFEPIEIKTEGPPSVIMSKENENQFQINSDGIPSYERFFLERTVTLLNERGIRVVFLVIPKMKSWQEKMVRVNVPVNCLKNALIAGVPPAQIFAGLNEQQIKKYYYDSYHFNLNGARLYGQKVLSSLVREIGQ